MIKVTLIAPLNLSPFLVEFDGVKQKFTNKAAVELKNKLQLAINELERLEAADNGEIEWQM